MTYKKSLQHLHQIPYTDDGMLSLWQWEADCNGPISVTQLITLTHI